MNWERANCRVFYEKFKIPFTYSHGESVKLHPKSEMFTKNSKVLSLCLHWEKLNSASFSKSF